MKKEFKENSNLITSFNNSLSVDVLDVLGDFVETSIDGIIENEIINAIPIVKTVKLFIKGSMAFREKHFLKNTLYFLRELKNKTITKEKLEAYRNKIKNNRCFESELERVMFLIDKQSEVEKIIYIGKLYSEAINLNISYDDFVDYSELVDRIFLSDINALKEGWHKLTKYGIVEDNNNSRALKRLSSQGIGEIVYTDIKDEALSIGAIKYYFDEYAQKFLNIIFDKDCK